MKLIRIISWFIVGLLIVFGYFSCKNELDNFAPDQNITLVYGLLSASDEIHRIKINKVFQGDDSIGQLSGNASLSEYQEIDAALVELQDDGFGVLETLNIWPFVPVEIMNKDSGLFYYPEQKIYELHHKLDSSKQYGVRIDKGDGLAIVSGVTDLIEVLGDIIIKPLGLDFLGLSLSNRDGPIDNLRLELNAPVHAKVIEVYLDFYYQNKYDDNSLGPMDTLSYYIGKKVINRVVTRLDENQSVEMNFSPTSWYNFIAAHVPISDINDGIMQRKVPEESLNFRFISGGEALNTYMEVASPSTGIVEVKPEYTNIVNGVGLWSSRSFNQKTIKMSPLSMEELVFGKITGNRRFCINTNNVSTYRCD